MLAVSLLLALGLAIALPVLATKGRGWRGLWFGLAVPFLLLALFLGSEPTSTKEQTEAQLGYRVSQEEYELISEMDPAGLAVSIGAFLGCLIAGCVFRESKTPTAEQVPKMESIFCTRCGKYSVPGSQFCMGCGAALATETAGIVTDEHLTNTK